MQRRDRLERAASGLERERHRDVGPGEVRDRVQRVELERVEVVEAVGENGSAPPGLARAPQRVQRPPAEQLLVRESGRLEPVAVRAVDRSHLVRVGAPRTVAGPPAQGRCEARRVHMRSPELGHEARGSAREARLGRGLREHAEVRAPHRLFHDQLALEVRGHRLAVTRSCRDLLEQPLEAQHPCAEHRAALRQLALGVLHVAEGRHHQDRLVVEAGAQPAQHLARLGGVRGAGYESEWHTEIVATRPDRLRARRSRQPPRAPPGSARPAAARASPAAPSPGSGA